PSIDTSRRKNLWPPGSSSRPQGNRAKWLLNAVSVVLYALISLVFFGCAEFVAAAPIIQHAWIQVIGCGILLLAYFSVLGTLNELRRALLEHVIADTPSECWGTTELEAVRPR